MKEPNPVKQRGPVPDRLVIDPAKAGEGSDRLLGKKPKRPPTSPGSRVRSKKPKAK